jgi:hypothetical protein
MIPVPFFTLTPALSPQGRGKSRYGSSQVHWVCFVYFVIARRNAPRQSFVSALLLVACGLWLRMTPQALSAKRFRHVSLEPAVHKSAGE